jgi:hypothetical protein
LKEKVISSDALTQALNEAVLNLKDLSVVLMENALIEQAIQNHKLMLMRHHQS